LKGTYYSIRLTNPKTYADIHCYVKKEAESERLAQQLVKAEEERKKVLLCAVCSIPRSAWDRDKQSDMALMVGWSVCVDGKPTSFVFNGREERDRASASQNERQRAREVKQAAAIRRIEDAKAKRAQYIKDHASEIAEQKYHALLNNAKALLDAKLKDAGIKVLQRIVAEGKGTQAAKEAQKVLDGLN